MSRCAWDKEPGCDGAAVTQILHPYLGPTDVCVSCGRKVLDLCANGTPPPSEGRRLVKIV